MCSRVAEINQYAVAHVPGDEAVEPGDYPGDGAVISGDDVTQILGIEPRRQLGRADEIAEHYRELAALGAVGARSCGHSSPRWTSDLPNWLSAASTELRGGLVLEPAGWARRGKRRPALGTEAPGRCVFRFAAWAAHSDPQPRER